MTSDSLAAATRAGSPPESRPRFLPKCIVAGILTASALAVPGCGGGYRETVIPAKEVPPLERARQMLGRYAEGQPVGSDFMGFGPLKEELEKSDPEQAALIGEALAAIEKSMLLPAEVKAIARRALADLDKTAVPR